MYRRAGDPSIALTRTPGVRSEGGASRLEMLLSDNFIEDQRGGPSGRGNVAPAAALCSMR